MVIFVFWVVILVEVLCVRIFIIRQMLFRFIVAKIVIVILFKFTVIKSWLVLVLPCPYEFSLSVANLHVSNSLLLPRFVNGLVSIVDIVDIFQFETRCCGSWCLSRCTFVLSSFQWLGPFF